MAGTTSSRAVRNLLRSCVFLSLVLAILANAASAILESRSPGLAIALNPFNTDARVQHLALALGRTDLAAEELARLERRAESLVAVAPGDARAVSLLGEVYQRQGRQSEADLRFNQALKLSPTEINALTNQLRRALRNRAMDTAVDTLDLILRRWPDHFEAVKPLIGLFARDVNAALLMQEKLDDRPPWRGQVVRELVTTSGGTRLAKRLLLVEAGNGESASKGEVAEVIGSLMRANAVADAYRVFLLTLTADERRHLGHVFNHDFRLPPDQRRFNWKLLPTGDADISLPYAGAGPEGGGLAVRFRGVPARLGNVSQVLALPPGRFAATVRASAFSLLAPKGLFWRITCAGRGGEQAVIDLKAGSYQNAVVTARFDIPADCPLQVLSLRTRLVTPTWRQRYEGMLLVHDVSVVKQ